jgi:hypothetical protein
VLTVLWQAEGFNQVPQLWWRGLGLLWMRLTIPVQSFRTGADDAFRALLVEPRGLALTEDPDALPPVDLQRWVLDALDGRGPIDADGLRAIPLPLREALQVNLARFALSQRSPRCLEYVWLLDGAAHRDLFELAARSPHVRFAQAASELLARLDALR